MSEAKRDTRRAAVAAAAIIDNRDASDAADIMVALEHTVAAVLLTIYQDHKIAAGMLNEGLVAGVEGRIALHQSKTLNRKR
jgi:hypothetical protein